MTSSNRGPSNFSSPETGMIDELSRIQANCELVQRRFLDEFRRHASQPDDDLPILWLFRPTSEGQFSRRPTNQIDWLVTLACEEPGCWHAVENSWGLLTAHCALAEQLNQYARLVLPYWRVQLLLARKHRVARGATSGMRATFDHYGTLLKLAERSDSEPNAPSDKNWGTAVAHSRLLDALRGDIILDDPSGPTFGELDRNTDADGRVVWRCRWHRGQ